MYGPADKNCPFWRKPMIKVCHTCPLWKQIRGTDANTGEEVDGWDCSLAWLPMLLIENSQQQRQTGAAVESLRNETVKTAHDLTAIIGVAMVPASRPLAIE
ncbi:MAG: hypothetical protein KIS96_03415 [Bauldia sp.]|nr:hypothetical protein [Bauldia sp.]